MYFATEIYFLCFLLLAALHQIICVNGISKFGLIYCVNEVYYTNYHRITGSVYIMVDIKSV